MEQLLKSNRSFYFTFIIILLFFNSCQTNKNLNTNKFKATVINDTIMKNGSLIFDSEKGFAYFLENESLMPKSKHQIANKIKKARYIVLLRRGLNSYKNSSFLSLSICNLDERLTVNMKKLFYNRYAIIELNDFTFYKIDGSQNDLKERLIFCMGE